MAKRKAVVTAEQPKVAAEEARVYKALVAFRDRDGKVIQQGAVYTSDDPEWISYLAGSENRTGKPVIE